MGSASTARRRTRRTSTVFLLAGLLLAGCGAAGHAPGAAPTQAKPQASAQPAAAPSTAPAGSTQANATKAPAAKLTPVSLQLAWIPIGNQLPFYLALDRGYYKAGGLAVTLINGRGSTLAAQQVAAGQADLGQADLNSMALARAKGGNVEAVMVQFPKSPFGLFAAKQKGIKTWKDLYGKTVAESAGSPETFLLPATFKKLGLDYAKVHVVVTGPAEKTTEYLSGKVDAVGTDVASLIPAVDPKRPSNHLWFGDVLSVPYLGVFGRDTYIQAHPQVVRAFVAATLRATRALASDPKAAMEAANDMVRANPGKSLAPGVYAASWKIYEGFLSSPDTKGHPLGWQSAASWKAALQVLHQYAGLRGDMNPQDYFTNAYLPKS